MPMPKSQSNYDGQRSGLVGIDTVAARLGVQVRHVRRLVNERRIPFIKWGHLLRFDGAEIESWLDTARRPEHEDESTSRAS